MKLPKWAECLTGAVIVLVVGYLFLGFIINDGTMREQQVTTEKFLDAQDKIDAEHKKNEDLAAARKYQETRASHETGIKDFEAYLKEGFEEADWYKSIKEITQTNGVIQFWTSLSPKNEKDSSTLDHIAMGYSRERRGAWMTGVVVKDKNDRNLTERFNIR